MHLIITVGILVCVVACSLCGCSKKKITGTVDLNTGNNYKISKISNENVDVQNYWSTTTHSIAKGEGGYYYQSDSYDYLLFYDEELKDSYPVCGKADCHHDTIECNAYIGHGIRAEKTDVSYLLGTVYYYQGYIYLLSDKGDLVKFAPDGSSREVIANVYTYEGRTGINLVFCGDDVYVYDGVGHSGMKEEMVETITRYSLDGKEKEVVVEYRGVGASINNAKIYGNQLFFTIEEMQKKEVDGIEQAVTEYSGLYVYNVETGEYGKAIDKPITGYCIDSQNNLLYYFEDAVGLFSFNIETEETKIIMEADEQSQKLELSCDGKYVYTSNKIWNAQAKRTGKDITVEYLVLKADGTIVNRIACNNASSLKFGDEENLFIVLKSRDSGGTGMPCAMMSKSNIETASEWTVLPDKK